MESVITLSNNLALLINIQKSQLSLTDWQTEKLNFVPLRGSKIVNSETDFDLEEEINKFLDDKDKKVLLLMGDSGAGKSLYTQSLVINLWQNFSAQSPIPIWISLPSLKKPVSRAIEETFENYGFTKEQIGELSQTRKFIFILDAYDEIRCEKNLYQTNNLDKWDAKIIFTCRREYLYAFDNYKIYFWPFLGDKALYSQFQEMIICPFNVNQIQTYVNQYIKTQTTTWKEPEKYQKAFNEISGLKELIKTPFIMKLTMEALPLIVDKYSPTDSKERISITRAALYDVFINQWFLRQELKLKAAKLIKENEDIKAEFWQYAKGLAQEMHNANLTQIVYDPNEESDLFGDNDKQNPWQKYFNPQNTRIALLQTSCLVREVSPHHYAFIHASLLEYFLTRNLYENIITNVITTTQSTPQLQPKDISNKQITPKQESENDPLNVRLIVKEAGILQFLADRVLENKIFEESYLDKVLASRNNPIMKTAAANAISVLNLAKISFTKYDFSNIQIPDADLSYGIFDGTDFNNADLSRVNYQCAWLRNAKFNNANMQDVYFGVKPPIPHEAYIYQMYCSINERWLVTRNVKKAFIWDIETGELLHTLAGHTDELRDIAVSPDETLVATCGKDKTIRLWDVTTGKLRHLLSDHGGIIFKISFHPQNNLFASCSNDSTIRIWDSNSGKCINILQGNVGTIRTIHFSHDGMHFAAASTEGHVLIWAVKTWELKYKNKEHNDSIYQVKFSPDNRILASGSDDKTVRLWDVATGLVKFVLPHKAEVKQLDFSPDGSLLITTDYFISLSSSISTVTIWNTLSGEIYHKFTKNMDEEATNFSFNSDGTLVAVSCRNGVIHVIDISSRQEVLLLKDTSEVQYVIFSPSEKYIISGGSSKEIKFWDIKSRKKLSTYNAGEITSLAISPDGMLLAYGHQNGTAYLMNLKIKKIWRTYIGHKQKVTGVAFSSDGKLFATSCWDNYVRVWDIESNQLLTTLSMSSYSITFSKDCKFLAAGGALNFGQGGIKIWHVGTWEEFNIITTQGAVYCVDINPDIKLLASGNHVRNDKGPTGLIRDINIKNDENVRALPGIGGTVQSIKFSPDGKILAVAVNKVICLYDIASAKFLITLKDHVEAVMSVAFSPDGKLLASGSVDNTIHIWDLTTKKCLTVIISQSGSIRCVIWQDNDTLISGNGEGYLNCWKIIQENNACTHRLMWSIQETLYAESCNFNSVKNLSTLDTKLLLQLQPGIKPSSITAHPAFATAKKVNEENAQQLAIANNINAVLAASRGKDVDMTTLATKIMQTVMSTTTPEQSNKPAAVITMTPASEPVPPAKSPEAIKSEPPPAKPLAVAPEPVPPAKSPAAVAKNVGIYSQPVVDVKTPSATPTQQIQQDKSAADFKKETKEKSITQGLFSLLRSSKDKEDKEKKNKKDKKDDNKEVKSPSNKKM